MTNVSKCAICNVAATQKCGGCKNVVYCGKEHQKQHWKKGHKSECKCYEITTNALLGRHMRATRDIRQGEIILREVPLIYGPKVACAPLCLGCHRALPAPTPPQRNFYKCSKCAWPMCGKACESAPLHADECALMTARHYNAKIDFNATLVEQGSRVAEAAYCVILPLRLMLLKRTNPAVYERFAALEHHLDERLDTPLYKVLGANLVTFVRTVLGLSEWEERDILRVAATLDTNSFEVRQTTSNKWLRAIYPTAAMISHDCVSNARHTFEENMQIIFIAKTPIAKGEIIATSYTQPLKSTLIRRTHLSQAKCFDCTCARCADPMEMGTFAGAIQCSKCKVGKIISTKPLNNVAPWRCQLCAHEIPAKEIIWGNAAMQKEIETLDKTSPRQFEEFIHRYRDTLHEKNTHVLQVKYALTQLYGSAPGFRMSEMNDAAIKRKVELCQELLEIAELFDGGCSIFRGNLLLDLQEALLVQAKREFAAGLLTRDATQEKLMEAMELLKEAVEIMKLEVDMKEQLQQRTALLAKELEID